MLGRLPIGVKVFIAPAVIIVLMLCVMLVSELAVWRQQAAFLHVVGGPLTTSTATTRLLLAVGEVQSEMLRYAQLRQRLSAEDRIVSDLRLSVISKYQYVDTLFEKVRSTSGPDVSDAISNISDFLTIHRAVSLKIVDGAPVSSMTISTLMAHYQQLQSYIVELATRSLESAQAIEDDSAKTIENFSNYLRGGSIVIIVVSILLTYYVGRAISQPITNMISIVSSIAAGNLSTSVPGMQRRDEIGAMARAVDVLQEAYRELRVTQANLIHAEKMASLGQLTAGIAHEIKNPLNFVNNFAGLSAELLTELSEALKPGIDGLKAEERTEVEALLATLNNNLSKIAEHGRRADGIVKSMLLHSRGGGGERQSANINSLIEEAFNLAYHGARAQDKEFNIAIERELDPNLGPIELVPQDITRVFLNLFGNAFYATKKRQQDGKAGVNYRPVVRVTTRDLGYQVEARVRDNGVGVPPDVQAKMFTPFFTTKPTGEGTGLGLSISYEIIVQQHGGTMTIDSRLGEFTELIVQLPRRSARAGKPRMVTGATA